MIPKVRSFAPFSPQNKTFRKLFRCSVGAACLFLLAVGACGQYQIKSWTTDSGLPQNTVHSILQTPDGYLWLATLDGLVRFDGVRFTVFNKNNSAGIESNRLTQLLIDPPTGDLWIGTEDSGVTRCRNGEFRTFAVAAALPNEPVRNLVLNERGELLAITNSATVRWNGEEFVPYEFAAGESADELKLWSKNGAPRSVNPTILGRYVGKRVSEIPAIDAPQPVVVNKYLRDRRGRLWIGTADSGLLMLDNEKLTSYTVKDGLPADNVLPSLEDRKGNIWAVTEQGAVVIDAGGRVTALTTAQGLSDNAAASIYEDREGEIWIGTFRRGLNRVNRQSVAFYSKKDGLLTDGANPIFEDAAGDVWIGGGDLTHWQAGVFKKADGYRSFSKEVTAICANPPPPGRVNTSSRNTCSICAACSRAEILKMKNNQIYQKLLALAVLILAFAAAVSAQTMAFTSQGRLTDGANAANGGFDMQFRLFDTAPVNTGMPLGTVLTFSAATNNAVNITGGVFTLLLDFGAAPFTAGAGERYLEISVKRPADGAYTTLSPRQPLTSTPFAIRTISANAADGLSTNCVSCVTNSQIDSVDGAKITGTINNATVTNATSAVNFSAALSGEVTGTQNATGVVSVNGQPAVKISKAATEVDLSTSLSTPRTLVRRDDAGNFSAAKVTATTFDGNVVNAGLQYNLGGNRVLSIAGTQNTFAGINNGIVNTSGRSSFSTLRRAASLSARRRRF